MLDWFRRSITAWASQHFEQISWLVKHAPDHEITEAETSAGVTPTNYQYPPGDVRRYGAVGDDSTDNSSAFATIKTAAQAGIPISFPEGTFRTSTGWQFTDSSVVIRGKPGKTRIKLTASATYVVQFDLTGEPDGWGYGPAFSGIVLDGQGNATYGLDLKAVINGAFDDIQATNVVTAGMYWHWVQLCAFRNYICSNNYEDFSTTPVNGILEDSSTGSRGSSANTVINPTIEHVSGAGIKCKTVLNTVFINGTSEGNDIGIDFGDTSGNDCIGNAVVGMDLEVNTTTDIMLRATARANNFYNLEAGFESPAIQCVGALYNNFFGGFTGGFSFDANSNYNNVYGTRLLGAGDTITDSGTLNTWHEVMNFNSATPIAEKTFRRRGNFSLTNGQTATIDCATTSYAVVTAGAGASGITIGAPTNPVDGMELDITIHNSSGGALTTTWNATFHIGGWADAASGDFRSARFRYDSNYSYWACIALTTGDQPG